MKRLIAAVTCGMLMACNTVEADYSLTRVDPLTGDVYVIDHHLTLEDCSGEMDLMKSNDQPTAGILSCERMN